MSLGWMSESTMFPSKARVIEGVSGHSIIRLRAEAFRPRRRGGAVRTGGGSLRAVLKNPGVDTRSRVDELEASRAQDVRARLEDKALIYDRMRRGGYSRGEDCLVDFQRSAWGDDDDGRPASLVSEDMRREQARDRWERALEDEKREEEAREKRRMRLDEVIQETHAGRERVLRAREQRAQRAGERTRRLRNRIEQRKEWNKRVAAEAEEADEREADARMEEERRLLVEHVRQTHAESAAAGVGGESGEAMAEAEGEGEESDGDSGESDVGIAALLATGRPAEGDETGSDHGESDVDGVLADE